MGVFFFTYADNGRWVSSRGYLYLTETFQKAARLPNPLPFRDVTLYGRIYPKLEQTITVNVYALLVLMLYHEDKALFDSYCRDGEDLSAYCEQVTRTFQTGSFLGPMDDRLTEIGTQYLHDPRYEHTLEIPETFHVPALACQKAKDVLGTMVHTHPVPLLITRKKLHLPGDLPDIAEAWGFTSGLDPAQGTRMTENCYYKYQRPKTA